MNRRWKDVWAICLLAGAVFALVSLYSESAGVVGAWLRDALRYSVGRAAGLPPFVDHSGGSHASSIEGSERRLA